MLKRMELHAIKMGPFQLLHLTHSLKNEGKKFVAVCALGLLPLPLDHQVFNKA